MHAVYTMNGKEFCGWGKIMLYSLQQKMKVFLADNKPMSRYKYNFCETYTNNSSTNLTTHAQFHHWDGD